VDSLRMVKRKRVEVWKEDIKEKKEMRLGHVRFY
jgi:hypothetical protein